jgi:hypothetical protein
MSKLVAQLFDTETGEEAVYFDDHWDIDAEGSEFIWTEGGMSCACNRAPIFHHTTPCCTSKRYKLASLELDGKKLLT